MQEQQINQKILSTKQYFLQCAHRLLDMCGAMVTLIDQYTKIKQK